MLEEGVELKMVIKLSKKAKYYSAKNSMYIMTFELYIQYAPS